MAVLVIKVVVIVTVVVAWVEAVVLGWKYFLYVISASLTTNSVSYNFTHHTIRKIYLYVIIYKPVRYHMFLSVLLALQVVSIEIVVAVNATVIVVLAVVCTY